VVTDRAPDAKALDVPIVALPAGAEDEVSA